MVAEEKASAPRREKRSERRRLCMFSFYFGFQAATSTFSKSCTKYPIDQFLRFVLRFPCFGESFFILKKCTSLTYRCGVRSSGPPDVSMIASSQPGLLLWGQWLCLVLCCRYIYLLVVAGSFFWFFFLQAKRTDKTHMQFAWLI